MTDADLADLATIVNAAREGHPEARKACERAWRALTGPERAVLTQRELAAALGCCERTVRTLTKSGRIPCLRLGDSPRYRLEECLAALGR